jgi:hypothetical protein
MAKATKLTDSEQVTEHIKKLEPSLGKIIQAEKDYFKHR